MHFRGDFDPWLIHHVANTKCPYVEKKITGEWLLKESSKAEIVPDVPENEEKFSVNATCSKGLVVLKSSHIGMAKSEAAGCSKDAPDDQREPKFICSICLAEPVRILFTPCMHIVTCLKCGFNPAVKLCCMCRAPIKKRKKVFF